MTTLPLATSCRARHLADELDSARPDAPVVPRPATRRRATHRCRLARPVPSSAPAAPSPPPSRARSLTRPRPPGLHRVTPWDG